MLKLAGNLPACYMHYVSGRDFVLSLGQFKETLLLLACAASPFFLNFRASFVACGCQAQLILAKLNRLPGKSFLLLLVKACYFHMRVRFRDLCTGRDGSFVVQAKVN